MAHKGVGEIALLVDELLEQQWCTGHFLDFLDGSLGGRLSGWFKGWFSGLWVAWVGGLSSVAMSYQSLKGFLLSVSDCTS